MELAYPTNTSWSQFKSNWANITFGGLKYLLHHPLKGPRVVSTRLQFALQKKSLTHPLRTPHHFSIQNNSELLVYTQIFIEQNLRHPPMLRDLRHTPNPIIIDVGSNCGFVTKWLNTFNPTLTSYAIEVLEQNIQRALSMDKEIKDATYCPRLDTSLAPHVFYHRNAGWKKSGEKLTIFIADRVSSVLEGKIRDTVEVETLAVNDIPTLPKSGPVFLLKIDTDGSNIQVLEGARETLKRTKWLLIEEDPGVLDWCKANLSDWTLSRLTHCDLMLQSPDHIWEDRFKGWLK